MKLSWWLNQVRPYKRYMLQNIAIVFLIVLINFAIPLSNRAMINSGVLAGETIFVIEILTIQAALYGIVISLHFLRSEISSHISNRLIVNVTGRFIRHTVRLPMSYFNQAKEGDIASKIRDLERVQRFAAVELTDFTAAIISLITLGPLLLWIHSTLFLIFFATSMLYIWWIFAYTKQRQNIDNSRFAADSASRSAEIGIIRAIQDIKIAGIEKECLRVWERVQIEALKARADASSMQHWQIAGGNAINRVGLILIAFISARETIAGTITLGDLMVTTTISMQLAFHVSQILEFTTKLQETTGALRRVDEVLKEEAEKSMISGAPRIPLNARVEFNNVVFSYPNETRSTLKNISLKIEHGSTVALIGPSGSGKSTILKLLLKLYEPSSGGITIGSKNFAEVDMFEWRSGIGAVMQDGTLFAGSIAENIAAGNKMDLPWLDEVLAAAQLSGVLEVQPNGLDTLVGPAGKQLSAGQTQRILIARALYKRPSFLVFDEATNALDALNEASIMEGLRQALPDTTIVIVAHRLNTIRNADCIYVVEHGVVTENGKHSVLMEAGGAYSRLVETHA